MYILENIESKYRISRKIYAVLKTSIKKLYEQFRGSLSHGIVAFPCICALNLFLSGDPEKSKNALTELYYSLCLEVLSNKYELSPTYDVLSELFAEVSSKLQEATISNKLKREEDKIKNEEIKKMNYTILNQKYLILKEQNKKLFKAY